VEGVYGSEKYANVSVSWLFKLFKVRFVYREGESNLDFYLCGKIASKRQEQDKKAPGNNAPEIKKILRNTQKSLPIHEKKSRLKTESTVKKKGKPQETLRERLERIYSLLTDFDYKIIMVIGIRFLKKLARVLKPDNLEADGVIGLDDPYATGLLLGAYEAVAICLNVRSHLRFSGDFNQRAMDIEGAVAGHIRLGSVLWPVIWLCTRKPVFMLLLQYNKSYKRKDEADGKRRRQQ
jgi:hypothetical protein